MITEEKRSEGTKLTLPSTATAAAVSMFLLFPSARPGESDPFDSRVGRNPKSMSDYERT